MERENTKLKEIAEFLDGLKFRRVPFGADAADVYACLADVSAMYAEAIEEIRAERAPSEGSEAETEERAARAEERAARLAYELESTKTELLVKEGELSRAKAAGAAEAEERAARLSRELEAAKAELSIKEGELSRARAAGDPVTSGRERFDVLTETIDEAMRKGEARLEAARREARLIVAQAKERAAEIAGRAEREAAEAAGRLRELAREEDGRRRAVRDALTLLFADFDELSAEVGKLRDGARALAPDGETADGEASNGEASETGGFAWLERERESA